MKFITRFFMLMFFLGMFISPGWAQTQTLQQILDSGIEKYATPPGTIHLTAPLTITTNGQTVDLSASTLECDFDADCVIIGDPANYSRTSNVTLIRPKGAPATCGGTHSFIVVYGQRTHLYNVMTVAGPRSQCGTSGWYNNGNFGHIVTVVSDQAFTLDGLDNGDSTFYCNTVWCASAVYAPGPFQGTGGWGTAKGDNAALGWLSHMQIHPECEGNGIDWDAGNTLSIRDSVIQGYAQFGVRAGVRRGGYGGVELDNVYMDLCTSTSTPTPTNGRLPNVGTAGLINMYGGAVTIHSDRSPRGTNPLFAQTGSSEWLYYVVANQQTGAYNTGGPEDSNWTNDSEPLYLGSANTDDKTPVNGQFPVINGAAAYRVLKTRRGYNTTRNPANNEPYGWISPVLSRPKGTGNFLVATVLATSCTVTVRQLNPDNTRPINEGVCTFTDPMTTPLPYTTVNPDPYSVNPQHLYYPDIWFWPGDVVLGGGYILSSDPSIYGLVTSGPSN